MGGSVAFVSPLLCALVIASCGDSYGGEDGQALPPREDASGDAGDGRSQATTDAPPGLDAAVADASVPPCDLTKPFRTPVAVPELNSDAEDSVSGLSPDELTIYVSTNKNVTGVHVFYATRATRTATWGKLQLLFPNGSFDDWSAGVTQDGLTAIVTSDRNGMHSDLYVATRGTTLAAFGPLGAVAGATNSTGNEEGPHWTVDGKTLYFDSTRTGNRELFRVAVTGSTFGVPQLVTELSSTALDAVPVLSADELTIYFLSLRAPTTDGDIYVATRTSKALPFGAPKPLENVNSPQVDAPGHLSLDGCTLYMSSRRAGTSDVYVARRPK